jgi:hypothetical protein
VIWYGIDLGWDPDIYVTITVNFKDKPAGCNAMAATREATRLFSSGKDDVALFLTERTYGDDRWTHWRS